MTMLRSRACFLVLAILLLAFLPAIQVAPRPVLGVPGPPGGVSDPLNQWAPYGPFVKNLDFSFYNGGTAELNAFDTGQLDLTDFPVPASRWVSYDSAILHPDILQSLPQ